MNISRQVFFVVFASLTVPASLGHCKKHESRKAQQLPVRTYIVDNVQDGLSGFAVYQEVAPEVWLQRQRRPPPSVQLCKYDRLGSHFWPPTAVCWVPLTPSQQQSQSSLHYTADSSEAAPEVEILPFKSRTSTFKSAEVSPGVQIGFLAGFADLPIVKSFAKMTDALGVNDMPGLGKQTMTPPLLIILTT